MKKTLMLFVMLCLPFGFSYAKEINITMNKISAAGIGESIGVVAITETQNGLRMTPYLHDLTAGDYQFTINETVSCHGMVTDNGSTIAGMAAGNSMWRMPNLRVAADGKATAPVEISNVSMTDLSKRTLIISSRGFGLPTENRIACGSLEQY